MSIEREELPVDILFVGAGPACLTSALHLKRQLAAMGNGDVEIAVIEKGQTVGAHILSGAVVDPRPLEELLGEDWRDKGVPVEAWVDSEEVRHLSATKATRIPVPPMLKNHGFPVINLSDMVSWLKDQCEQAEVMVFEGFPGSEFLRDAKGQIAGVRTMDKGLDVNGEAGPNFEPGADIHARCTVLGEGVRGSLTKQLVEEQQLQGRNPEDLRYRRQRTMATTSRSFSCRQGASYFRLATVLFAVRRIVDLRPLRRPCFRRVRDRTRCEATLERPVGKLPALEAAPLHRATSRRRRDPQGGGKVSARGRILVTATSLGSWIPDHRRLRIKPEREPAQRCSHGDEGPGYWLQRRCWKPSERMISAPIP